MANNPTSPEFTSFTLDTLGRYACNTAHEALTSAGIGAGIGAPPPDARPFDVIVVGGGTFGGVFAQHLYDNDTTRSRRILVVERGPYVLPEHVQNLPFMGGLPDWKRPWDTTVPGNNPGLRVCLGGRSLEWGGWSPEPLAAETAAWPATVVAALTTPVALTGAAAPAPPYYQQSAEQIGAADTNDYIFGTLHTALRAQLATALVAPVAGTAAAALPLTAVPDHPRVRYAPALPSNAELQAMLGLPVAPALPKPRLLAELRLEAPLAVQSRADPGRFPINKFSALPLLVTAARAASTDSFPYDQLKQVTIVTGWHVQELVTRTLPDNSVAVTAVRIVRGWGDVVQESFDVPLADGGIVVLAMGTVESTRLARQTFRDSLSWRAFQRMGENLTAHLRSNLTIRVPRTSIPGLPATSPSLEVSALFVKGRTTVAGSDRHFHLQVTASGLPLGGTDSEAELFRKVPDWDTTDRLRRSDDQTVVVTVRGIGEMASRNPLSRITESTATDFGRPRALVSLGDARAYADAVAQAIASGSAPPPPPSAETGIDAAVWERMDDLADEVACMVANGAAFEILMPGGAIAMPAGSTPADVKAKLPHKNRRDGLATTHHESGTLRMGSVADAVTDEFGRVHDTINCFVVGPALFPTAGSPNPMLTGVALARRTADYLSRRLAGVAPAPLLASPAPFAGDGAGWQVLFDGTLASFRRWRRAGVDVGANNEPACAFRYVDGQILTVGAGDFALLWYEPMAFSNMLLKLQFRLLTPGANSGVFVRMRDPRTPLPAALIGRAATTNQFRPDLMTDRQLLDANTAWKAVFSGFEVQIDDGGVGDPRKDFHGIPEPNGLMKNRTGAIYKIPAGDAITHTGGVDTRTQVYTPGPPVVARPWADTGGWYELEVEIKGDVYDVRLGTAGGPKTLTSHFTNTDALRSLPASSDPTSGYIGLQAYSGQRVAFRHVQVKPLP